MRSAVPPSLFFPPTRIPILPNRVASQNKNTTGSCSLDLRRGGETPESGKRVRGLIGRSAGVRRQNPILAPVQPCAIVFFLWCGGRERRRAVEMVPWEGNVSDETMGTFAPIVLYWVYAGGYQLILHRRPLERYRLHTRAEEEEKNLVSLPTVVRGVLLQQLVQAIVAMILFMVTSDSSITVVQPPIVVQVFQFLIAMLVMDSWQYFVHRYMHQNKFLYRHIHSQHHRLIVPYAIGALYNHPLEGLLLDTLGGAISFLVSGMTPRTAVFFFCFAVLKTVDDHCGLWLPYNIFQHLFQNNTAYHDIHHQLQGTKYNYSQPFFSIWDRILGTHMPYDLVSRKEGGFEARPLRD